MGHRSKARTWSCGSWVKGKDVVMWVIGQRQRRGHVGDESKAKAVAVIMWVTSVCRRFITVFHNSTGHVLCLHDDGTWTAAGVSKQVCLYGVAD